MLVFVKQVTKYEKKIPDFGMSPSNMAVVTSC